MTSQEFRVCRLCNRKLPLLGFYRRHDSGKLRTECKKCQNKRSIEYNRKYRKTKRGRRIIRRSERKYYTKLKREIFELLGNKCNNQNCPIPRNKLDIRALQIDHINSGGTKERRNISRTYYRRILTEIQNGSKEYQLLCAYCNWLKRYTNNEVNQIPYLN